MERCNNERVTITLTHKDNCIILVFFKLIPLNITVFIPINSSIKKVTLRK